jgi:hypothetical protein
MEYLFFYPQFERIPPDELKEYLDYLEHGIDESLGDEEIIKALARILEICGIGNPEGEARRIMEKTK